MTWNPIETFTVGVGGPWDSARMNKYARDNVQFNLDAVREIIENQDGPTTPWSMSGTTWQDFAGQDANGLPYYKTSFFKRQNDTALCIRGYAGLYADATGTVVRFGASFQGGQYYYPLTPLIAPGSLFCLNAAFDTHNAFFFASGYPLTMGTYLVSLSAQVAIGTGAIHTNAAVGAELEVFEVATH